MSEPTTSRCPTCGGRGWHTAGGNDPAACGRCAAGAAFAGGESEYQWRVRCNKPMPEGWPWEDDYEQVREEAEVMRGLGFGAVRVETRLRPQDECCASDDWEVTP